jgi:hypothetical protein
MTGHPAYGETDVMETFLPKAETVLRNAYSHGVYDHPGLASVGACHELLLREHLISCLYWFEGRNPLETELLRRRDEVLPTRAARDAYRAHFRTWGQNMTQARIEGLAIRKGIRDFIRSDATVMPPMFFYPTIGIDFLTQNYLPDVCATWQKYPQEAHHGVYGRLYDRTAVRAREVMCLLGIFLEHAREEAMLSDYCLLFDRTLFTIIALNPVLRLGMPETFGEFVRQSLFSFAFYFYSQAETIRAAFEEIPSCYYDQLLEGLSELCNLKPRVTPRVPEDGNDYLGAA